MRQSKQYLGHFVLPNFMKIFNWMSKYEKKLKLAAHHQSTSEEQDFSSKYNDAEGISISEEIEHNKQASDVFFKIKKDGLLDKVDYAYYNTSTNGSLDYELFDDATKEFDSYFKEDIQKINRSELSLKNFKRKVGIKNFDSFAKTAYLCTNDIECSNVINSGYSKKDIYNDIGIQIVKEMVNKAERKNTERRKKFLDRTNGLSAWNIVDTEKDLKNSITNSFTR